jgi:hypothetical protein
METIIPRQRLVKHEYLHENEGIIKGCISYSIHLVLRMEVVTDSSSSQHCETVKYGSVEYK